jgi:hypothetical protein
MKNFIPTRTFTRSFQILLFFTIHFSLFTPLPLHAQTEKYNVLNVVGEIKVKSTGKPITKGDVISSEDQVTFANTTAMAAVFSPSKGRFTLKAKPDQKAGSEYLAYVKASIVPATQVLAARDVELSDYRAPDKADEICSTKFLVLPNTIVPIGETFAIDADHFYFIRMEWNGEEVSKKLNVTDKMLSISTDEILKVDDKSIPAQEVSNYKLYYYDAPEKRSVLVCVMDPIFPDAAALQEEVKIMLDAGRAANVPEDKLRTESMLYLIDYYGTPAESVFHAWYDANFKL